MSFAAADVIISPKLYHYSGIALAALTPACLAAPSVVSPPLEVGLAVAAPLHAWVGLNYIISDYVPLAARGAVRMGTLGITGVSIVGLAKLAVNGPGIVNTAKMLWKSKSK